MSNQENKTVYFDLHATGAGYINRAREVSPENAINLPSIEHPVFVSLLLLST
jgi:hypothetical protein